ncbi:5'-3'-deoxyribonucleotidase [Savagea sp. SN6]|uniref:5'-3'-deoxyribonucleotidase n=1 Tax=Savagea serpentis TaxID=2785297 RepID=A0A8J7GLX3_9BACL|nr:5'-3'-deoxyribonucleotidase [Savagea serpentis]
MVIEGEKKLKKRIAVDMDEVLADFSGTSLKLMNEHVGTNFTKRDLEGKKIMDLFPNDLEYFFEKIQERDYFRTFPVIEGSQEVLHRLSEHYEIMIATAAMEVPNSFDAKYDWLREHFPFLNPSLFVFCGDKKVIHADYLIDDNITQLTSFTGRGVMFEAPNNVHVEYDVKMKNWAEVEHYFLKQLVE